MDAPMEEVPALRRAVLLDAHPLWLEVVEQMVREVGMRVVGKATSPAEALSLVEEHQPDVLLAEIYDPGSPVDGILCLHDAHERCPGIRLIVLSSLDDPHYVNAAFAAGASAYVVKTARRDAVTLAIRQVFESAVYFAATPAPTQPAAAGAASGGGGGSSAAALTRRELEILRLVAEGYTNAKLAETLWVTEQTIKFHLSNIYRKLGVANRTQASRWAQLHYMLPALASGAERPSVEKTAG